MLHKSQSWLMIIGFIVLAPLGWQESPAVPLDEALEDGRISAEINGSNVYGELSMTLTTLDGPVAVTISPGTRFVPENDLFAEVVAMQELGQLVEDTATLNPVKVLSLSPSKALPSQLSETSYMVVGQVEADLLELVEVVESRGRVAAQLAVWAKTQDLTVDDVVSRQNVAYSAEDIVAAKEILSGSAPVPTEDVRTETPVGGTLEPTPTVGDGRVPTPDVSGEEQSSSLLMLAFVVFVLAILAAALAAGVNFVQKKQRSTPPKSRKPTSGGIAANGAKKPTRRDSTIMGIEKELAKALILTCKEGPHAGRILTINRSTILAKSSIAVKVLDRPGVSTPHLYVYWTEEGLEVKDLNSKTGTWRSGRPLKEKFNSIPVNSGLTLGNETVLVTRADGLECDGEVIQMEDEGLIISRASLAVQALGYQDSRISDPHCLISGVGTTYEIKDLQSSNGVFLNDKKLGTSAEELSTDDEIQIGASIFKCQID